MVEDSQQTSDFESFTEARKKVRERRIVERAMNLLEKSNGEMNRDEIAKELGISGGKLSDAFTKEQKRGNPLLDFTKKAGVGIAGLGLLSNIDKIQNISGEFVNKVLENKVATGLTVGLASFWQGFVKPKIDDPKNDLSELEVFTRLMDSQSGSVAIGAIISAITLPQLLAWIEKQITKVLGGLGDIFDVPDLITELHEDSKDDLEAFRAVENGTATPTQEDRVECIAEVSMNNYDSNAAAIAWAKARGEFDEFVDACVQRKAETRRKEELEEQEISESLQRAIDQCEELGGTWNFETNQCDGARL